MTNTRASTLRLDRSTLYTRESYIGLRTMQYPARRRFISHSEWNAGMSVLRLALTIISARMGVALMRVSGECVPTWFPMKGWVSIICGD